MAAVKSYRKPYNPPVQKMTWWLKNPFYTFYMCREGTAVLALVATLEIVLGIFLFAMCDFNNLGSAEATAPWDWYVNCFLGNWFIILLNIVILGTQLFHAVTWFNLMPKAVRVFLNKNSTEMLPDYVTKLGLYGALVGATVVILVAALASM